jgi:hypothetical protein
VTSATWAIRAAAMHGVIGRPMGLPEWILIGDERSFSGLFRNDPVNLSG